MSKLIILADGGALSDFNKRLESEQSGWKQQIDFLTIPKKVIEVTGSELSKVECSLKNRILFCVGGQAGSNFVKKMESDWTTKPLPLSFCKYERGHESRSSGDKAMYHIRFHSMLGYYLGRLAQAKTKKSDVIVSVVTNDTHLIPVLGDARASGLDVRLAWFLSSLSGETLYFAARNSVPVQLMQLDAELESHASEDKTLVGLIDGLSK